MFNWFLVQTFLTPKRYIFIIALANWFIFVLSENIVLKKRKTQKSLGFEMREGNRKEMYSRSPGENKEGKHYFQLEIRSKIFDF